MINALIESSRTFHSFRNMPCVSAKREILEELGLHIEVGPVAVISRFRDTDQSFFRSPVIGGRFGTGTGKEILGDIEPHRGVYRPIWLPVDAMLNQPVRPQSVCRLIVEAVTGGCPDEPLYVDD